MTFTQGLISRPFFIITAICLGLTFVLPTDGLGFSICLLNVLSDHPCPGCGLTRSLINISHADFGEALRYHPFGYFIYSLTLLILLSGLLGRRGRASLHEFLGRHQRTLGIMWWGVMILFVVFGLVRMSISILYPEWFGHLRG